MGHLCVPVLHLLYDTREATRKPNEAKWPALRFLLLLLLLQGCNTSSAGEQVDLQQEMEHHFAETQSALESLILLRATKCAQQRKRGVLAGAEEVWAFLNNWS
jgi:hypothetical protein